MELLLPAVEDVVLLTQDTEFEHLPLTGGRVLISRVPQNLSMERRIQIWMGAIREFVREPPAGSRFEITLAGVIERLPD